MRRLLDSARLQARHALGILDDADEAGAFAAGIRPLRLPGEAEDEIVVQAGAEGIRFLLASGHPFGEPVAWQGPIVMNTRAELRQAFHDMQQGTFIRHK